MVHGRPKLHSIECVGGKLVPCYLSAAIRGWRTKYMMNLCSRITIRERAYGESVGKLHVNRLHLHHFQAALGVYEAECP